MLRLDLTNETPRVSSAVCWRCINWMLPCLYIAKRSVSLLKSVAYTCPAAQSLLESNLGPMVFNT